MIEPHRALQKAVSPQPGVSLPWGGAGSRLHDGANAARQTVAAIRARPATDGW